ncbi:MAG TPA: hypothetical protein VH599_16080 [Ktedonobacterales bacterium]|jgi:hypothetical protein
MDILILSMVSAPFLIGMFFLIWGWRSMHHRLTMRAEAFPEGPYRNRMVFGCLFVGMFFPVELAAARIPLGLEVAIVMVFSLLLIIVGEFVIRSALVSLRAVPPGLPWLVFLGVVMLSFLPLLIIGTLKLPAPLGQVSPFVWIIVVLLSLWGQSLLMKHWQRIGEQRAGNSVENL